MEYVVVARPGVDLNVDVLLAKAQLRVGDSWMGAPLILQSTLKVSLIFGVRPIAVRPLRGLSGLRSSFCFCPVDSHLLELHVGDSVGDIIDPNVPWPTLTHFEGRVLLDARLGFLRFRGLASPCLLFCV